MDIRHIHQTICNIYLPFIPFLLSSVTEVLPVSDGFIIFACRWETQAYTSPLLYAMAGGHGEGDACMLDPLTASRRRKEYDEEDC